jgi:hypothetical protein
LDVSCAKTIAPNPQTRSGGSEITSVVARARDAEGFGQASRAAGKSKKIARALQRDISRPRHFLDALKRFERAEKNSPGLPLGLTRNVQAIVIAVDEIDVGVTGRSKQDRSAGGFAGEGVGRGIILSEVSLDLDDAARQAQLSGVA